MVKSERNAMNIDIKDARVPHRKKVKLDKWPTQVGLMCQ